MKKKINFSKEQVEFMEAWIIGTVEQMPTIETDFGFANSPKFDLIDLSKEEIINRLKLWFIKLREKKNVKET
jgi:hypothetical protein